MKQNIPPKVTIGVIVAAVLLLGIVAFNTFRGKPKVDASQFKFSSDAGSAKQQAAAEWFKNHPNSGGAPATP